jgi:hypothetical protein
MKIYLKRPTRSGAIVLMAWEESRKNHLRCPPGFFTIGSQALENNRRDTAYKSMPTALPKASD